MSLVCNCPSTPYSTGDRVTDALQRAQTPPGPPAKVRPPQQQPVQTSKSTQDLLHELSQIKQEDRQTIQTPTTSPPASSPATSPPISENPTIQKPTVSPVDPPNRAPAPTISSPVGALPARINMRTLDFLNQVHPQGIGIILGVGRSPFALELLQQWRSSPGLYMCDPFIHIWKGYDSPANGNDKEHQMIFEDLRNKLAMYEGRYSLVRDFSNSFAVTFKGTAGSPPVSIVWVDNNPDSKAVHRDLTDWAPTLAPNGVLAGPDYRVESVKSAVHSFASQNGMQVGLFSDGDSWYISKSSLPTQPTPFR